MGEGIEEDHVVMTRDRERQSREQDETEELLERAGRGDDRARERLLSQHRARLRQMVSLRLDRRLVARIDPSDIVQEALAEAALNLNDYLRERPVPFYPWLRRIAWERLVDVNRRHLLARRRSVIHEQHEALELSDPSARMLVERLISHGSSPSLRLQRQELRERVQAALDRLDPRDREILVLRYLEQLSTSEIAAALEIGLGAAKMRHLRALQRLRTTLGPDPEHPAEKEDEELR
jgi:RNA polymerase sigma-70 factor (ECF subfamily)